jgi:hypothetical protein
MSRPRSALTVKQAAFVDAKLLGANDHAAAKLAGAASGAQFHNSELVRAEIKAARRWLSDITQITRLDVIEGMLDGIEMGRHLGDANAVIKGWVEVAKLLGYAQPELKITHLTVNQMSVRSKLEQMSLEELLAISEGQTIDGSHTQV